MKRITQFRQEESGDIAIEALLGLIVFILGVMAVLMFSMIMRLEATTQYAVDQVAKEVSEYYYIVEKSGILPNSPVEQKDATGVNNAIEKGNDAISQFESLYSSASNFDTSNITSSFKDVKDDANAAVNSAKALKNQITSTDWKEQLTILLQMTLHSGTDRIKGYVIANPVCSMLFPKYISTSDLDDYLKKNGIVDGKNGLHFENSSFLSDGYTINVVLNYKINLKQMTFGMYDGDIYVQQTACTAAWVHYKGAELETTMEENIKESIWDLPAVVRGEKFVEVLKAEGTYGESVDAGVGFDMYDADGNVLTQVKSMNFYGTKATTKNEDGSYTLNEAEMKAMLRNHINAAKNSKKKMEASRKFKVNGEEQTLPEDAKYQLVLVVPEEAKEFDGEIKNMVDTLNKDGVTVKIVYKDKAKQSDTESGEA